MKINAIQTVAFSCEFQDFGGMFCFHFQFKACRLLNALDCVQATHSDGKGRGRGEEVESGQGQFEQ
jgi:hypothetical protein